MRLLVDTNILLRIVQPTSTDHVAAKSAVLCLFQANFNLCVVPQVVYEFWVVATRPLTANGLGFDVQTAEQSVLAILDEYQLLRDERSIFDHWRELIALHAISGKPAHDARLVAAMRRHQISSILTFNSADFTRFPHIQVLTPADVVAGQLPS